MPKASHPIRKLFLVAVLCVLAVMLSLWLIGKWIFPSETTSPSDYPRVLKDWSPTGLVTHFPPAIPTSANNVRFSAYPGFLQGGGHVQLRLQLPPGEVMAIEARLKGATTRAYAGGDIYTHYNADHANLPTTSFHTTNDKDSFDFPAHYTLYVLHSRDAGGWNHGETTGIAVSRQVNEVIYWAEQW